MALSLPQNYASWSSRVFSRHPVPIPELQSSILTFARSPAFMCFSGCSGAMLIPEFPAVILAFWAEPRAWGEALSSGKVVHIPEFQAFILIFPELQAFICTGPVQGPLTRDCPCIDARGGRGCQSTGLVKGHTHTELSMHRDP